jgi:hypothetical protein
LLTFYGDSVLNIMTTILHNCAKPDYPDNQTPWRFSQRLGARAQRIEEALGWAKMIAGLGTTKLPGTKPVGFHFTFASAAYNFIRIQRLLAETSEARP